MGKLIGPHKKRNCRAENIQCGGTCLNPTVKTCRLKLQAQVSKSISEVRGKIKPPYPDPKEFKPTSKESTGYSKILSPNPDDRTKYIDIPGELTKYLMMDKDLSSLKDPLIKGHINDTVLKTEYPKMSGRLVYVSWDVNDGVKKSDENSLKIALEAKRLWKEKVLPTLNPGDVLKNEPNGGAGSARDRAYQRYGFSPVDQNGSQYSIVDESGKLRPLNIMPFPHYLYEYGGKYRQAVNARTKQLSAQRGEEVPRKDPELVALVKEDKTRIDEELIKNYGDWRGIG